jgi:hypothetical protein
MVMQLNPLAVSDAIGNSPRDASLSAKAGTNFADRRRSHGIDHSRAQATEFFTCLVMTYHNLMMVMVEFQRCVY